MRTGGCGGGKGGGEGVGGWGVHWTGTEGVKGTAKKVESDNGESGERGGTNKPGTRRQGGRICK